MGKDPDRIRQDIERTRREFSENEEADRIRDEIDATRADMGDTTEALGHKADVKSRVKESVSEKKDAVVGSVVGTADSLVSRVGGVVPDKQQMKQGARKVGIAKENPFGLAIGGAAVGFLAGLFAPSTRMEDERIGEVADQMKETAKETGQEALERGKQVASEAASGAKEAMKDSGQQQSEELASSLKESAREVATSGSTPSGGSQSTPSGATQ
jgi:gas vesicle protein